MALRLSALSAGCSLSPEISSGTAILRLEGLGKLRKSNDLIGTRTRDLPSCSIAPQPSTLPLPRSKMWIRIKILTVSWFFFLVQKLASSQVPAGLCYLFLSCGQCTDLSSSGSRFKFRYVVAGFLLTLLWQGWFLLAFTCTLLLGNVIVNMGILLLYERTGEDMATWTQLMTFHVWGKTKSLGLKWSTVPVPNGKRQMEQLVD
jgi:hypothetical protein